MSRTSPPLRVLTVAALMACGGERAVTVTAAVPSTDLDLDDPWIIELTQWVSAIDRIELTDDDGEVVAGNGATNIALDFAQVEGGVEVVTFDSPRGDFAFGFGTLPPAVGSARLTSAVTDSVLLTMDDNGWTQLVSGRAFGPVQEDYSVPIVSFAWGFAAPVRAERCGEGVTVGRDGAEPRLAITLDPTALFATSLSGDDPPTGFGAIARADTDGDEVITQEELAAAPADGLDGQAESLLGFMEQAVARGLRLGAEGLCDYVDPA